MFPYFSWMPSRSRVSWRDLAVRAAGRLQELLAPHFHVLHALELLADLLDLLLVRQTELGAEALGAAAFGERARRASPIADAPRRRPPSPRALPGRDEAHGVQVRGHALEVLRHEVRDEASTSRWRARATPGSRAPSPGCTACRPRCGTNSPGAGPRATAPMSRSIARYAASATAHSRGTSPSSDVSSRWPSIQSGGEDTRACSQRALITFGAAVTTPARSGLDSIAVRNRSPLFASRVVVELLDEPPRPHSSTRLSRSVFSPLNLRHGSANDRMMPDVQRDGGERARALHLHRHGLVEPSERAMLPLYTCPRLRGRDGRRRERELLRVRAPSSASRMRRASASSNGGTASCNVRSSMMYAFGSRSWRLLSTCPSFTYVGPERHEQSRSCAARLRRRRPCASRSARRPASCGPATA